MTNDERREALERREAERAYEDACRERDKRN